MLSSCGPPTSSSSRSSTPSSHGSGNDNLNSNSSNSGRGGLVRQVSRDQDQEEFADQRLGMQNDQQDDSEVDSDSEDSLEELDELRIDSEEDISRGIPLELVFASREGIDRNLMKEAFTLHPFYNEARDIHIFHVPIIGNSLSSTISSFSGGLFIANALKAEVDMLAVNFETSYLREENLTLRGAPLRNLGRETYALKTVFQLNLTSSLYSMLSYSLGKESLMGSTNFNKRKRANVNEKISFYLGVNGADNRELIFGISRVNQSEHKLKMMGYFRFSDNLSTVFSATKSRNSTTFLAGLALVQKKRTRSLMPISSETGLVER